MNTHICETITAIKVTFVKNTYGKKDNTHFYLRKSNGQYGRETTQISNIWLILYT